MRYCSLFENANYNLQDKFNKFNRELFNSELPNVPIQWSKLKNVSGKVEYKIIRKSPKPDARLVRIGIVDKNKGVELVPNSVRIKISNLHKRTEEELDGILVHEMIHLYMVSNGEYFENHGSKFNAKLKELNAKTNFEIPLTDKVGILELEGSQLKEVVVVYIQKQGYDSFGLLNSKVVDNQLINEIENKFRYFVKNNSVKQVTVVRIKSIEWSRIASQLPIARSLKTVKYYKVPDLTYVNDLENNGKVLTQIK